MLRRTIFLSGSSLVLMAALSGACTDRKFGDAPDDAGSGGSAGGGSDGSTAGAGGDDGGDDGPDVTLVEDCSNGRDDDDDGLVDLEDPACEKCSPLPPTGWSKPFHYYLGAAANAPECDSVVLEGGVDPFAEDLSCTACSCTKTGTETCTRQVTAYAHAGMAPTACASSVWSGQLGSACVVPSATTGYRFGDFKVTGTTCTPSGGSVSTRPEPYFKKRALGCSAPLQEASCGADSFERPDSPAGYGSALCTFQEGDVECPSDYPDKKTAYSDIADDRSCSDCSCTSNRSCTGTVTTYSTTACGGSSSSTFIQDSPYDCYFINAITDVAMKLTSPSFSGACAPSVAGQEGAIAEEGALTICCR